MTTENKQPDERAAFEVWAREEFRDDADDPCKRGQCGYLELTVDWAWIGWQARAAKQTACDCGATCRDIGEGNCRYATQQANKGDERTAYVRLIRHSTGDTFKALRTDSLGISDLLREGWEIDAAAPQAVTLSDEQIKQFFADLPLPAWARDIGAARLKELLDDHPTEQRMSDAERDVLAERERASEAGEAEGCTAADAAMLREANHSLAAENDRLRKALAPFARLVSTDRLSWAMVEYAVDGDPEKQTFQRPQMQRAFNRAAALLRENIPAGETINADALDLPEWVKNANPPTMAAQQTVSPTDDAEDAARLDWLREECCDLRSISVPTGGDDADVNWIVIQHHMAEPREREIGRGFSDDPRDAIDAARKGDSQ